MSDYDDSVKQTVDHLRAQHESRRCRFCCGGGIVTVFHREYSGEPTIERIDDYGNTIRFAARVTAHCECQLGRYMRENTSPDAMERMPFLKDVLDGHPTWTVDDPTVPELEGDFRGMTFTQMIRCLSRRIHA